MYEIKDIYTNMTTIVSNLNITGSFNNNLVTNLNQGGSYGDGGCIFFNNDCVNATINASFINSNSNDKYPPPENNPKKEENIRLMKTNKSQKQY